MTIPPLASLDEPDSLKRLSKMMSDLHPPVDLTELCAEINALTGFADEFFHASEASARVDDLPVSISAVLMAEACNIGLEPLIRFECSCTDPTPAELDKSELSAG
ncbi:Tn3 family transposase [Escherichia coli]|uniref:Tn3 family transposase n=1 Tax=Escherichia coli TaxID=562 RepID=UPI00292678C4|nr:Tn3 family transposase [Escherichia coli]